MVACGPDERKGPCYRLGLQAGRDIMHFPVSTVAWPGLSQNLDCDRRNAVRKRGVCEIVSKTVTPAHDTYKSNPASTARYECETCVREAVDSTNVGAENERLTRQWILLLPRCV